MAFYTEQATKAISRYSSVNMQKKSSVPDIRGEPRTANCIGDRHHRTALVNQGSIFQEEKQNTKTEFVPLI